MATIERGPSFPGSDTPRQTSDYNSSTQALQPTGPQTMEKAQLEPRELEAKSSAAPAKRSRRKLLLFAVVAILAIIIIVVLCVYFLVIRPNKSDNSATSSNASSGSTTKTATRAGSTDKPSPTSNAQPTTGGDGSIVTMEDGTTFVYKNPFGGYWVDDPNDPFNNGARAQSWTPALNETFRYGIDRIRGVNVGGWLNTEPFIAPALYQKYANNPTPVVDEWTLCLAMRADTAGGGIGQLEEHYKTFITEKDFADMAGAGLNYIRLPMGYWAIETREGEPYLANVSWQYVLKAIKWARKYGIRINLDLHATAGTQNTWAHSGRRGNIGWLNGPMGYANAQRSLDYIRIITQFISQPQYKDVVTMFSIMNEPRANQFGIESLQSFYYEAYRVVRSVGGTGEGNGPWISISDGFFSISRWAGFMQGADRVTLDNHPYRAFGVPRSGSMASQVRAPCDEWATGTNTSTNAFGLTHAGEFSNAATDCALFLNGVDEGIRYEGTHSTTDASTRVGSCEPWRDYQNWDAAMKQNVMEYAMASMDALRHWFFWTWNIGPSLVSGKVEAPDWSYKLGLQEGWMPKDPRSADGFCRDNSVPENPLPAWHTGGVGAGQLASTIAWPPVASLTLPSYTQTGPVPTLAAPTYTIVSGGVTTTANAGSGWANAADQTGMAVPIATCTYLDPYIDSNTPVPPPC